MVCVPVGALNYEQSASYFKNAKAKPNLCLLLESESTKAKSAARLDEALKVCYSGEEEVRRRAHQF